MSVQCDISYAMQAKKSRKCCNIVVRLLSEYQTKPSIYVKLTSACQNAVEFSGCYYSIYTHAYYFNSIFMLCR